MSKFESIMYEQALLRNANLVRFSKLFREQVGANGSRQKWYNTCAKGELGEASKKKISEKQWAIRP